MTPDISIAWLLLNIVVITITLIWGIYRFRKGIWYRKLSLKFQAYLLWGIGGIALLSSFYPYAFLYTEHLWYFENVGYPEVFWKIIKIRWGLFFGFFLAALVFMNLNAIIVKRLCPEPREFSRWVHDQTVSFHRTFFCGSIIIAIIFAVPMMSLHDEYILYQGQPKEEKVALANAEQEEPQIGGVEQQETETTDVDQGIKETVKAELEDDELLDFEQLDTEITEVNVNENLKTETRFFGKDVNFYLFSYPMHKAVSLWIWVLVWVTCIVVGLLYNFYYRRDARSMGVVKRNIILHGSILWLLLLTIAIWRMHIFLWGKVYASTITDYITELNGFFYMDDKLAFATQIYSVILILIGVVVAFNLFSRRRIIWYMSIVVWIVSYFTLIHVYPFANHWWNVKTYELEMEGEYIRAHIQSTRDAYDINTIKEAIYEEEFATLDMVKTNPKVVQNIQLWDRQVLFNLLRSDHLVRHHNFYRFTDVDRYRVGGDSTSKANRQAQSSHVSLENTSGNGNGNGNEEQYNASIDAEQYRQVLIAAQEIDPDKAEGWRLQKLSFTHGYGVYMSPANEIEDWDPVFWVKGIPVTTKKNTNRQQAHTIYNEKYTELKVTEPRIYYGEMTYDYVIVNTDEPEYDLEYKEIIKETTGENTLEQEITGKKYHYEGTGGVQLGGWFRRLCFSVRFHTFRILRNEAINSDSRIMFWRKIGTRRGKKTVTDRLSHIAPFLDFDPDPYIVINNGQLYWIVDFYVTSKYYPNAQFYEDDTSLLPDNNYLEPQFKRFKKFNYIRNPGVAIVNAYTGEVNFYAIKDNEVITDIYSKAFPNFYKKLEEMPEGMQSHLRFPDYLTRIQAKIYGVYHVQDAEKFFNRGDRWHLPSEIYYSVSPDQEMMPYYAMLKLPGEENIEFVNMVPFTPEEKEFKMKAWLVSRCDTPNYGERIVYILSNPEGVAGPKQIEVDITNELADKVWADKPLIRGNLQIFPIDGGIFYVEPVYQIPQKNNTDAKSTDVIKKRPKLKEVFVAANRLASDQSFIEQLKEIIVGQKAQDEQGQITDAEDQKTPTIVEQIEILLQSHAETGKALEDIAKLLNSGVNGSEQENPKKPAKKKQN